MTSCVGEMARRLPNSTLVTVLVLRVARESNSTPSPVAKARIVPVDDLPVGQPLAQDADGQRTPDAEHGQAEGDRHPDQDGPGGAREADVGQGVGGEGVLPHDDEVADQAGGDRDERAADERVAHEVGLEHVPPVGLEAETAPRTFTVRSG